MFETVDHGVISGLMDERQDVIRDQTVWMDFWKSHKGKGSSVPMIDFQKEIVVVIHLGTRSTAGYEVNVRQIEDQSERVMITYEEIKPGPGCFVAQVLTQPYHIIKIKGTQKEVSFIKKEQIKACE